MAAAGPETQADWAQAFGRLMGRDVFPPDRNSFIHSPLELIGIALGISECGSATDAQRVWLASTIQRGFADRQFVDLTAQVAAACAERIVSTTTTRRRIGDHEPMVKDLQISDLVFLTSFALLVPDWAAVDMAVAEQEILSRLLSAPAPAHDVAEAAGLYVVLKRAIDRTVLASRSDVDPVARIVALCRRFPLFVERLQARQRHRSPYIVEDEYDVQDLLHAILKLHFDDVRPEEWTPSYAGNASRIDFLLPRERTIIEAKMTRPKLGQKEVTNELINRYRAILRSPPRR
ncbi:MAG: transposase [Geminicoccaceae bacterium]